VRNTWRFAINTTVGLGGILDPASRIGLDERETDFGETLYVYGAPEGAYLELPVLGPSTERDALGKVVDFVINPTRFLLGSPEDDYLTAAGILSGFGSRYDYSNVLDDVLYRSADSYTQTRLIYLQNRRYELGAEAPEQYFDPYEAIQ
jgi:phospholipid-binding lipoprotein MlaA